MGNRNERVVITGIGPVSSVGNGVAAFWEGMLEGRANIRPIPFSFEENCEFRSRFYIPFPDFDASAFLISKKHEFQMEKASLAAVTASRLALKDAGISFGADTAELPADPADCTVILGTGICTLKAGFEAFAAHAVPGWKHHFNRLVIPMIMPDASSAWISILHGITGPAWTLNASCASGTVAIGEAFLKIKSGARKMAVTGGVECLEDPSGTVMRGFDSLGALTTSRDGLPRPFSPLRSGFLFAEGGACVIILETLGNALKRGKQPYAEIIGFRSNSDAYNIVQMEPSAKQMRRLTEDWMMHEKIDYYNAHGTGTQWNDELEAAMIRSLYGNKEDQPFVNSTKGLLGHTIGASGAFETAVTALSIFNSTIHRNMSENIIADLKIAESNIEMPVNKAITASFGFGGHNAALLLAKIE